MRSSWWEPVWLVGFVLGVAWTGGAATYDRQVVFDQSLAAASYAYSEGSAVAPSTLELVDGRFPVETNQVRSAPNGLRLRWCSAPGGDWRMMLKAPVRYGRRIDFAGDTLSFWCYAETELTHEQSPRVYWQDADGTGSPTIPLLAAQERLPARTWTEIRLPFEAFRAPFGGTDDRAPQPSRLASLVFVQGLDDGREHVMYVDDMRVRPREAGAAVVPGRPTGLVVHGFDRHFELSWKPAPGVQPLGYRIYRSTAGRAFQSVGFQRGDRSRYMDFPGTPAGTPVEYQVSAVDAWDRESARSESGGAALRPAGDDALLDMVQEACFRYYWDGAHPVAGMALEIQPGDENLVAVGASGFGLMSLVVGIERGFITRAEGIERFTKVLRFLDGADRFHGAWPHFLDGRTGRVNPYFGRYDNGGDLVETAFLVQGLLTVRSYFDRPTPEESWMRETITRLWQGVEWDWYRKQPDSDVLYWHWSPDAAWHISHPLIGWNETMIVYLLAIASPTHSVPASLYYSGWAGQSARAVEYRRNWSRTTDGDHYANGHTYFGIPLEVGSGTGGELFFTHFSFLGFDPRGFRDRYTEYFRNNQAIARINHAYCVANPRRHKGYSAECWGLSAGINSGGGKPLPRDDNGTINCMASLASFPYTPGESMAALKHFYRDLGPKVWGVYGFYDGFNESQNWFEDVYMGLNQAPIVVMIENHRSGLPWRLFTANPEIRRMREAIEAVRAAEDTEVTEGKAAAGR